MRGKLTPSVSQAQRASTSIAIGATYGKQTVIVFTDPARGRIFIAIHHTPHIPTPKKSNKSIH